MKLSKPTEEFLWYVRKDCEDYEVKFLFSKRTHIKFAHKSYCSGYFSGDEEGDQPELVITTKPTETEMLCLLVHEWNHMQQWKEQCSAWKKSENQIFEWYGGEVELTPKQAYKHTMAALNVELDCEMRSAESIILYNLPIDVDKYTQRANAYVLFYHAALKNRQWSTKFKEPYNIPKVTDAMSTKFDMDYTKITPEQFKLFEECFGR
jgi:hypothetical protein